MKLRHWFIVFVFLIGIAGCTVDSQSSTTPPNANSPNTTAPGKPEDRIAANRAKLSAADQKLAAEQEYCPIMSDVQLGAMGVPIKITVKDQTFFVCCKNCMKRAEQDPEKTMAALAELKKQKETK